MRGPSTKTYLQIKRDKKRKKRIQKEKNHNSSIKGCPLKKKENQSETDTKESAAEWRKVETSPVSINSKAEFDILFSKL